MALGASMEAEVRIGIGRARRHVHSIMDPLLYNKLFNMMDDIIVN